MPSRRKIFVERVYHLKEVAAVLGVHVDTVRGMVGSGRLGSTKLGPSRTARRVVPDRDLQEFLARHYTPAGKEPAGGKG